MTFQHHAKQVGTAAKDACNCLSAILSRKNRRMVRRRLIATVVEAKLLHGCEEWSGKMTWHGLKTLESAQREAAISVIRGYPTVSCGTALVLTGMVPIRVRVEARQNKFRTGERKSEAEVMRAWQRTWEADQYGKWTRKLIPNTYT